MDDAIYAKLTRLLSNRFRVDPDQLTPDATFAELGLDSLLAEELIMIAPTAFGIDHTEGGLTPRMTLGEATRWIGEHGGHG
ncbi:phosphopantetheine-binding protein [Streptomyces sp. NPDC051546]|uniref:phosphopantetheine-binding protein n=1 Tax=Streptomyces sp. NPDC051546 TaxID=3365655 RepID=UPI0037BA2B14